MPIEHQAPDVLAMVIARAVHRDMATNRHFIHETYQFLASDTFPLLHPSLVVYVALTEGYGVTRLNLRLIDVDEVHPPLFEQELAVEFKDPLAVVEIVFGRSNIVFPVPGEYRVQLRMAGEVLRERRLWIVPAEDAESG